MAKKIFILACLLVMVGISVNAAETFRTWENFNFTVVLTPSWSVLASPAQRNELAINSGTPKGSYYADCLIGPCYTTSLGKWTIKLPVGYYYTGTFLATSYTPTHSINLQPVIDYKLNDKIKISNRVILQNTFYTTAGGYSLLVREMFGGSYLVMKDLSIILNEEIFIGAVADANSTAGFEKAGFNKNRVYAGVSYSFNKSWSMSPQYILETIYNTDGTGSLKDVNHYIFVGVNYTLNLSK